MNEEKAKKETLWYVGEDYDHRNKQGAPRQSDKVYVVELYPDGINPRKHAQTMWTVKASWGRRGKKFQSQTKATQHPYGFALYKFNDLIYEKCKKGYKKWEFVVEVEEMHMMTDYDA